MRYILPSARIALLTLAFFIMCAKLTSAQNRVVTYLNKQMQVVAEKDSAMYIRVLSPGDGTSAPYNLLEQYTTGEVYRKGKAYFYRDRLKLIGLVSSYQKDGRKISDLRFNAQGIPEGLNSYYHKNGKLKMEVDIPAAVPGARPGEMPLPKLISFYDSLGTPMVTQGTGHVIDANENFETSEGDYQDGYREGIWKGTFLNGKYQYQERFEKGKLLKGTSTDSSGTEITYVHIREQPEYPGGMKAFYAYVGAAYYYPPEAKKQQLDGTVLLGFVVDTLGKPVEIKVLQDLGLGTGEEALKVLQNSPPWKPGKWRGIPVRVSYTIPIRLNLSRRQPGTQP